MKTGNIIDFVLKDKITQEFKRNNNESCETPTEIWRRDKGNPLKDMLKKQLGRCKENQEKTSPRIQVRTTFQECEEGILVLRFG